MNIHWFNCKHCGNVKGKLLSHMIDYVKNLIINRYKCPKCHKITKTSSTR